MRVQNLAQGILICVNCVFHLLEPLTLGNLLTTYAQLRETSCRLKQKLLKMQTFLEGC